MFTLKTSFKALLLKGGVGGLKSVVEVTVNSKEEKTFVPITSMNSASRVQEVVFVFPI